MEETTHPSPLKDYINADGIVDLYALTQRAEQFKDRWTEEQIAGTWHLTERVAIIKPEVISAEYVLLLREAFPGIMICAASRDITVDELMKAPVNLGHVSTGMAYTELARALEIEQVPEHRDPTLRGNGRRKVLTSESGFPYPEARVRKGRK